MNKEEMKDLIEETIIEMIEDDKLVIDASLRNNRITISILHEGTLIKQI